MAMCTRPYSIMSLLSLFELRTLFLVATKQLSKSKTVRDGGP